MSFIDESYFINEINIPTNDNNLATISQFILRYEKEVLKSLLGYELYTALIADLNSLGVPQTQRFIDLVDGKEFSFEVNGSTINTKWEGLINEDKVSLISYYVYFNYRNQFENVFTGVNEVQSISENSTFVSVMPRLVDTWFNFLQLYGDLPIGINQYNANFLNNESYSYYNAEPSAYNFLLANLDDYPEWVFKPLGKLNIWGI